MKRIYIAGPYTGGDVARNVRRAMNVADVLIDAGYAPHVPHLYHFLHMANPRAYEDWMKLDFVWLVQCDALVRIPGESSGADREVAEANRRGIPILWLLDRDLGDRESLVRLLACELSRLLGE